MEALHLFEGYGLELEYMIVHQDRLDVMPAADKIMKAVCGAYENEVVMGDLAWSNELALHVIELKTNGPAPELSPLADCFQKDVRRINSLLAPLNGRLMPGGMHPWMNPLAETRLWPHDYNAIYEAYNRIFDCRGHGWSNLQSTHLNLPFYDDAEFGRLHAAIRLVLPLLPALAASTPVMDGRATGKSDNRLAVYRVNQQKIPAIAGRVIPESVTDRAAYEAEILLPLYRAIAPHDPEGILQYEWLNSRGAIARFERNTIEIRLLDIQEYPEADVAIAAFVTALIQGLVREEFAPMATQRAFATEALSELLLKSIERAENATITDSGYLTLFNYPTAGEATFGDLLHHLAETLMPADSPFGPPLAAILNRGCLATRILKALKGDVRPGHLREVYGELCRCLAEGQAFAAP